MVLRKSLLGLFFCELLVVAAGVLFLVEPELVFSIFSKVSKVKASPQNTMIVGALFTGVGLFLLVLLPIFTTITADKALQKFSIVRRTLLRKKEESCELSHVGAVELREMVRTTHSRKHGSRVHHSYALYCMMKDGREALLTTGQPMRFGSFTPLIRIPKEKEIGERLARFLGLPFNDRRNPTAGEMLSTIKGTVQAEIDRARATKNQPQ